VEKWTSMKNAQFMVDFRAVCQFYTDFSLLLLYIASDQKQQRIAAVATGDYF